MNYYFISCCTCGRWSCLSQAGSGALTDVCESTGALGCFSFTPSPLLIVAMLSRPLAAAQFGHCGGTGRVSSSCPAEPFSPASPSFQAYSSRRRSSSRGSCSISPRDECPSGSKMRKEAEGTTDLPLPAASRGCVPSLGQGYSQHTLMCALLSSQGLSPVVSC